MINNILLKNNLKITKARIIILEKIIDLEKPITAEELFLLVVKEDKINISTIYRNLNILVDKDIIQKATEINGQIYYLFNNNKHIHHLICIKCGEVVPLDNCPIRDMEEELIKTTNYKIISHSLEFRGICPKCLKN